MTDFFGSVRNIELMNDTHVVPQERAGEEVPPSTLREEGPDPHAVRSVSAHKLMPQDFLVSGRLKELQSTAHVWYSFGRFTIGYS